MRLIVAHEQPDFDAFASIALATVLYPGAVGAMASMQDAGIDALLRLYRDQVPLLAPEDVDLAAVSALVVVDTAERGRLGRFTALLDRVPVTVFDHHPPPNDPILGVHGLREEVGATVTLLVRRLAAEGVALPPALATLALLGLHEDTGDLTFDHVRPADHDAAAWLLRQGANLDLVRAHRTAGTPAALHAERDEVLRSAEIRALQGRRIAFGALPERTYTHGVSGIAGDLLAATRADAAIVIARMDAKTLVFARADAHVDVGGALQRALGGGGHARAAFARTALPTAEARARLLAALPAFVERSLRARDVMSANVIGVAHDATIAQARQLLARHAHGGMPVLDEGGGIVGVISRRDLDHALRHDLADAAVSGFMTRPPITAGPEATLAELEALIVEHDIGRIPITVGRALIGIVTRSDLVRAHHPRPEEHEPGEKVVAALPEGARALVADACAALAPGARLYLVGGSVRDGLLGVGTTDVDLLVEGAEARAIARHLMERHGGRLAEHPEFGTASVTLPSGLSIDVAAARGESYAFPGALPRVHAGDLRADLARRDFTVNALAVRLHPTPVALIDPFGGRTDLEERRLRVLHPLSFVEDPTRLVRGARLAGRLGLRFDDDARAKAAAATVAPAATNVSGARLRWELERTLQEARVAPALRELASLGGLRGLYGLAFDEAVIARLDAERARSDPTAVQMPEARVGIDAESAGVDGAEDVTSYLLALLALTPGPDADAAIARLSWPKRYGVLRGRLTAAITASPPLTDAVLAALERPGRQALTALAPWHEAAVNAFEHAPPEPKVRGRDVIALGLPAGPRVGWVLARLDEARARGQVRGFAAELAFARSLVAQLLRPPPA